MIGAGVGGLVAAACLARSGANVTVLEAQSYVGGCAGTFFRKRYRFDAGATVAAGFGPGGPMESLARLAATAIEKGESGPRHFGRTRRDEVECAVENK